jgi:SecD/SecF fusion protein
MGKNLTPKVIFIIVLLLAAVLTLTPPTETLKPGIDLAGGTSMIYAIDATDVPPEEKKDLSLQMITVLRRRIDPANIQNLVWRPQGSTRFEIQMPLASAEAREKRQAYESALRQLLDKNIRRARILRSLQQEPQKRAEDFEQFAQDSEERLTILNTLADAYEQRQLLQEQGEALAGEQKTLEIRMGVAGLELDVIKLSVGSWAKLEGTELDEAISGNATSDADRGLLKEYVKAYEAWAEVVQELTDPDPNTGANAKYAKAERELSKLNLTEDELDITLVRSAKSATRRQEIEDLKSQFADRADDIDKVVKAFDEYRPFRGRLDDPKDLQRMLKGAGILEFRILPTTGHNAVDSDAMERYRETLKGKGPKYASDNRYVWFEIEKIAEWGPPRDGDGGVCIFEQFGDKWYVLASNKKDEVLLHSTDPQKGWKLQRAKASQDQMGRRAIGFLLDERGGRQFSNVTGKNLQRPLCILLDGIAVSAPKIESRIRREGIITGTFSETEQSDMIDKLNAGSLPAKLIEPPISVRTIGPSIGAENRDQGIKAGLVGLVAVVLCMGIYYMLAGAIADVALLMNLLFVLAIMAFVRATFTLPGIAGIILTIGMSVDANVLIFERIREEQQRGSSLRIAIRNGYQRAFRTIFDANLTTFITAAILFWVASEEVKGFAIVLMLGICSSMFTALFVTRVVFDILLSRRFIKERLVMLRIIRKPNVNWMGLRAIFFTLSAVLIVGGLLVFFTRDDARNNKYDIEFTGGYSAQISLKEPMDRQEVENAIGRIGAEWGNPALEAASVYTVGKSNKQYEINTTETNKTITIITFSEVAFHTAQTVTEAIQKAQVKFAGTLSNLRVSPGDEAGAFVVTTSQMNRTLVKNVLAAAFADATVSDPQLDEVVNRAILEAFAGKLQIQENLQPQITATEKVTDELIGSYPELADFLGGARITCKLERPATGREIQDRLADLRFKPDLRDLNWSYSYEVLDAELNELEPNQPIESFVYISVEEGAGFSELTDEEWDRFAENETRKVLAAGEQETSLPRVTQIDPSVGAEAKTRALIAIVLSLFAIVTYIWVRFGDVRYGVAAITALVHDVCITLGAVTACTYIAGSVIGERLLVGDFKINLAMIAAFLTLIGYSLNDTIVVFDRIRENRKKAQLNPRIITDSVNQTISRTLLTSFTTFIVVLIMYIFGGAALRGFTFAIGFGIIVGTYSSIAIAAPVLLVGSASADAKKEKKKGK